MTSCRGAASKQHGQPEGWVTAGCPNFQTATAAQLVAAVLAVGVYGTSTSTQYMLTGMVQMLQLY